MGIITFDRPSAQQPGGIPRINSASPLAKGLVFCAYPVGSTFLDLVTRTYGTPSAGIAPTFRPRNGGFSGPSNAMAGESNGTATNQVAWPASSQLRGGTAIQSGTILCLGGITEQVSTRQYLFGSSMDVSGSGMGLRLSTGLTGVAGSILRSKSSSTAIGSSGALLGSSPGLQTHFFGYTYNANGANGKWLGARTAEEWTGGSTFGTANTNRKALLFTDYDAASYSTKSSYVSLFCIWDRELSIGEYQSLYDNPWQILDGFKSGVILPIASASGATGTSATTNAADTSSASGTTTVVGTSARTNANDTSTASGTTTVVGTSATTNAADTSSASGAVGNDVSGTSATTNANDTSSASGTTTVVGTSATTNAADTSTASGTTTVTGTSTTTNANDTATASGVAGSIAGTSATTNANDVASASGSGGPTPEPSASTGAGRSKRRQQRPVVVEIDGEDFVVESEAEAVALLDKAKEQAEQLAEVQIARAAKAERRKTGKVIADARKTLVVPQIKAPDLESYAAQVLADIRDTYASTMRTIEVAALLRKRDREEEDDEDVLLLLL